MIIRKTMMILLITWLSLSTLVSVESSDRWSRQTSNSEWIPLARPRSALPHQTPVVSSHSQSSSGSALLHNPNNNIQSLNLPPALQQEYQQQLMQLQKTQESIQKLLLLQQQLRSQQQLLQNQAYLPNAVEENKQPFRQNAIPNRQVDYNSEGAPPQLSSDALPPVYSSQQFKQSQEAAIEGGVPPFGPASDGKGENTDEEIQVVYVPAETLAQRGQSKEERNRDHNQFSFPRHDNRYPHPQQIDSSPPVTTEEPYSQEYVEFPRGQQAIEQFYKEARQKELDRLNEERKEIALQAKIAAAARQREQERAHQRDMDKKLKELAKIEELAKQRELERIREDRLRERQRLDEQEKVRMKEEKARQAEIERLAALERQKNAEIERSILRQKELEKAALQQEEVRAEELKSSEELHQQHHSENIKHKGPRHRSKPRRPHKDEVQEASTIPPPNQPPLAVFMGPDLEAQETQPQFQVIDALRFLRDAKTIPVLDHVSSTNPRVFVGPANLDPPQGYSKFDLPYLSSLDMNRVERRVDKLPFFVAPLSFSPPVGYYKIPFPHPHIGSVIVNSLDDNIGPSASQENSKTVPNVIDHNLPVSGPGPYQASYELASRAPYPNGYPSATPQYPYPSSSGNEGYLRGYEQQSVTPYPQSEEYATTTDYRKPNIVSSYSYDTVPTTPAYQDGYAHTRVQPNKDQEITSQLAQVNQHDYSQHRHAENPYQHPSQQASHSLNPHHGIYHLNPNIQNSYEEIDARPVGPNGNGNSNANVVPMTGYSLPPELPPIHPQLPGLVNSLLDPKESEADKFITTTISTTTEPTTVPTTTEAITTTHRPRVRQRGRVTVRTTTPSPTSITPTGSTQRNYERTRRPFNRSRSRFTTTTTTEEYKDTYEPSRSKVPETTIRYTTQEYRRPANKIQKFKNRNHEALNQIPNIQAHETLSDDGSIPEDPTNPRQYQNYNVPLTTVSSLTYSDESLTTERDYSKNPNYPHLSHDRFRGSDNGYQANLQAQGYDYDAPEGANINSNNNNAPSTPISVTPEYYYADKTESAEGVTDIPYSQVEYRPSINYNNNNNNNNNNNDDRSSTSGENSPVLNNNQYSGEIQPRPYESFSEPETTTEAPTTTEPAPVIIRQRVRARLGGRPRQDSPIQTAPRGSQDEFVHFSAVNQPRQQSTTARTRPRAKKPNYLTAAQVQSEGNDYVRIQSANRPHPKTIVQAAAPKTTTTTLAPASEESSEEEYGFFRKPNFNQPHNLISSKFRAPESPIQLQNVGPTDGTAADSSPTHTQVPTKNRQKYQTSSRPRPVIKSSTAPVTTTPSALDTQSFTTKPRVRAEEPKNRIRTRVRRPGRRRTTTTSTTTEDPLDENNNLPLEENYPRLPIHPKESRDSAERQSIYDGNYETLPVNSGANGPSRSDYVYENYPNQDREFMLNFGASDIVEEQQDQSSLKLSKNHHDESRLRPYSRQQPSDIYGSESQWSTKLTQSSFQPVNQLPEEDKLPREQKEISAEKEDAPEIITARPDDGFMTVLVSSDNQTSTPGLDMTGETTMPTDFGMKMSAEESSENLPRRRVPGKRRRVRIRVRPSPPDDFVTAESQHFNSAVNNLVQEQAKPNEMSPQYNSNPNYEPPSSEVSTESITTTPTTSSVTPDSTTIITETKEQKHETPESASIPLINETTELVKSDSDDYNPGVTEITESAQTTSYETTTFVESSTESTTVPIPPEIPRKSWDSTKAYTDWLTRKMEKTLKSEQFLKKTSAKEDKEAQEGEEEHPKNHRSEWSEVRYPDRSIFGFGRSEKQEETDTTTTSSTTQVPGVVSKTEGESSVGVISDYVQAIFDSMKTADEEHAILDNAPDLWDDENKPTTQSHSTSVSISGSGSTTSEPTTPTATAAPETTAATDEPMIDNQHGEDKDKLDNETKTMLDEGKESTSTINPSNEGTGRVPSILDMLVTTTTEPPTSKNSSALLGAILRTSTSTKVSHMTEICYRGRCVMTKPNKDSRR